MFDAQLTLDSVEIGPKFGFVAATVANAVELPVVLDLCPPEDRAHRRWQVEGRHFLSSLDVDLGAKDYPAVGINLEPCVTGAAEITIAYSLCFSKSTGDAIFCQYLFTTNSSMSYS